MLSYLVNVRNRAESTEQSRFPPPIIVFALSVPWAHVTFSSKPSCSLLCAAILDIISTNNACVLSLLRARLPPPHDVRNSALAAAGLSTFWLSASQKVTLRASSWSYWLQIVWRWLEYARNWAESLEKSRFSQLLLGWSPRWSWSIAQGLEFSDSQLLIMMID